jgi:hypothetical protein
MNTAEDRTRRADAERAKRAEEGMRGQGAIVEAMQELRDALNKAARSSDKYSQAMLWLTVVIGLLTLVQAIAAFDVIKHWFK